MSSKKSKIPLKLKKRSIEAFGGFGEESSKPTKKRKKKAKPVEEAPARVTVSSPEPAPEPDPGSFGDIYAALDAASEVADEPTEGLPSPSKLMQLAISADLDPSIFTERSFPVAANVIEWCREATFLGFSGELRPRQFQVLAQFFADVCYLCSDTHYVHTVPVNDSMGNLLDRFVLLEHGICPKCRRNRTEMLSDWMKDPRFEDYNVFDENIPIRPVPPNELVGVWGQRSGKSFTVATFAAPYVLHRYLALPNPTRYFEQASNSIFQASFVAPTIYQAEDNLWKSFRQIYEDSPWFRSVKQHNLDEGKRLGVSLYEAAKRFIFYPGKRIAIYMQAASSITLRGATRIFCVDGNALVNTTHGLIPIKKGFVGADVWVKNKPYIVCNHHETGRRPVQKTTLENGCSVTTTLDHGIKTLTPQLEECWKDAIDLNIGDYVAVNLGAKFPEKLELSYTPEKAVHRQLEVHKVMAELQTFTAEQLVDATGLKGIYSLTHRLIKQGMLKKTYVKGQGRNAGCVYELTEEFDLDQIAAEYRNHAFSSRDDCTFPETMTPELGYLLGYYVSKGSYAKGAAEFSFSNTNEAVVQHFVSCFETVFGFTPRLSVFEPPTEKTAYKVVVAYKVIKRFLRYVGMKPSVAKSKTVPWAILQAPKKVVLAFLSAYIEGDGSINDKYISMGSTSHALIRQLQLLLLNLEIVSKVDKHRRESPHNTLWSLRLRRYDSIKLTQQLTCPTKGKLFNFTAGKKFNTVYRIPFVGAFIDTSQYGGSVAKYAYVLSSLNADCYDSYALRQLEQQDRALYERAQNLIDTGIVWMSVISKKQLGSRPVFDITVESEDHAFVADGIVVHNCTMDEMGWFNTDSGGKRRTGVKDGTEVFNALENSLQTIRTQANRRRREQGDYNALDAYMFNISSPTSIADPIMQRAAVADKSPRMYYTHYATWEANPDEDEETIKEQKRGDPESLMRDFYAIPPRALSPYFPNHDLVRQLVADDTMIEPLFHYTVEKEHRTDSLALLRPTIKDIRPDLYNARVLAVDNGEVSNSFALGIARYEPETEGIVYEEFLEVAPYKGFHVDLLWCYNELIVPLMRSFQFVHVVFDRWNSAMQVLDLRETYGQEVAQRYTLKWKDFELFKHDLQDMKVHFPPPEIDPDELIKMRTIAMRSAYPRAHFQLQLTTVEQFGHKPPMKPENGTDDLFRVATLCHSQIRRNQAEYVKRSYGSGRQVPGSQSAGVFRGASSRGVGSMYGGEMSRVHSGGRSVGLFYSRANRHFRGTQE